MHLCAFIHQMLHTALSQMRFVYPQIKLPLITKDHWYANSYNIDTIIIL